MASEIGVCLAGCSTPGVLEGVVDFCHLSLFQYSSFFIITFAKNSYGTVSSDEKVFVDLNWH